MNKKIICRYYFHNSRSNFRKSLHITRIKSSQIKLVEQFEDKLKITINDSYYTLIIPYQGIGIKGKEMALVCNEKTSRTAWQTSSINFTHTLLVQTHNMNTVKEIAEQCRQL